MAYMTKQDKTNDGENHYPAGMIDVGHPYNASHDFWISEDMLCGAILQTSL